MKNYGKAMEVADEAIYLGTNYGNACVTKAELLIAMGDKKKALKSL